MAIRRVTCSRRAPYLQLPPTLTGALPALPARSLVASDNSKDLQIFTS